MSVDVRVVWLRAHCSSVRAQSSHWSINAAVMGTVPALHYEKKKRKVHPLHLLQRRDDAAGLCRAHRAHKYKVRHLLHRGKLATFEGTVPVGKQD